jgi:methyl-accepting chemotaxis protein
MPFSKRVAWVLARTRISDKLLLASCSAILPVAVMLWFVIAGFSGQIGRAVRETAGIRVLGSLEPLAEEAVQHHRLTQDLHRGAVGRAEWEASTHRMDEMLIRLAGAAPGAPWLRPLETEWAGIRAAGASEPAESIATRHTRFFGFVRNALHQAADDSELILDPALDSFYLVTVVANRMPALHGALDEAIGYAGRLAEPPDDDAPGDLLALQLEGREFRDSLIPDLHRSVEVAIRGNVEHRGSDATLAVKLPPLLADYDVAVARLALALRDIATTGQAPEVTALAADVERAARPLWKESLDSTAFLVERRLATMRWTRILALSLTTLAIAFAVWTVLRASSVITSILGYVVSVDLDITSGRLTRARERLRDPEVLEMLRLSRLGNGAVRDELLILLRERERMTETLEAIVVDVSGAGVRVNESVNHIAAAVQQLEATVSEQAASTAQVSTTSTEILATATDLARTMDNVSAIATRTAESADAGRSALIQIQATVDKLRSATESLAANLQSISAKTRAIDEVTSAIRKVAYRTNLLSLNASIEAERGAAAGGAFSVVSQEILKLADQTAASALDIEALIGEMQSAVLAGVSAVQQHAEETRASSDAVDELSTGLARIIEDTKSVAPQFDTVNSGMQAQAMAAGQISDAISQLSDAAHQTRGAIAGFLDVAGAMRSAAGELRTAVGRLSSS